MEFKCTNEECAERGKIVEVKKVTYKYVGDSLQPSIKCPYCKEIMQDVTPFGGYGHVKRSLKNASKNHFKRHKG